MKDTIRTGAILALSLASLGGCDSILGLKPEANVTEASFYQNEGDFVRAVGGMYNQLQTIYGSGATAQFVFSEMRSDNTTYTLNQTGRAGANTEAVDLISNFDRPSITGATDRVNTYYASLYVAVKDANVILSRIDPVAFANDSVKNRIKGEALFVRGLTYLNLVRSFGGVPLVTEDLANASQVALASSKGRASVNEVYDQIIKDATDASTMLWTRQQLATTTAGTTANLGRASKGAALMLLAKAYLDQGSRVFNGQTGYQRALTALDQLDALGGYSVASDYASIFLPANKNINSESVFEVQYSVSAVSTGAEASSFSTAWVPQAPFVAGTNATGYLRDPAFGLGYPSTQTGGGTLNIPTPSMALAYEAGDKRKAASIFYWKYPRTGSTAYAPSNRDVSYFDPAVGDSVIPVIRKFTHPFSVASQTDDNFPVFRYSDAVLMRAEALGETGNLAGGTVQINRTRTVHGGLAPIATPASKEAFRVALLQERRVELAFENQRWADLTRIKKDSGEPYAVSVMLAHGDDMRARTSWSADPAIRNKYAAAYIFKSPRDLLLPFPDAEILRSDALTPADQNPGY